jgi:hypothetical protein
VFLRALCGKYILFFIIYFQITPEISGFTEARRAAVKSAGLSCYLVFIFNRYFSPPRTHLPTGPRLRREASKAGSSRRFLRVAAGLLIFIFSLCFSVRSVVKFIFVIYFINCFNNFLLFFR